MNAQKLKGKRKGEKKFFTFRFHFSACSTDLKGMASPGNPFVPCRWMEITLRTFQSEPFLMIHGVDVIEFLRLGLDLTTRLPELEQTALFQTLLALRKSMWVAWDESRAIDLTYPLLESFLRRYEIITAPDSIFIGATFSIHDPLTEGRVFVFMNTTTPLVDNETAFFMFIDQFARGNEPEMVESGSMATFYRPS